jgi:hypothetical protein
MFNPDTGPPEPPGGPRSLLGRRGTGSESESNRGQRLDQEYRQFASEASLNQKEAWIWQR